MALRRGADRVGVSVSNLVKFPNERRLGVRRLQVERRRVPGRVIVLPARFEDEVEERLGVWETVRRWWIRWRDRE